ncbi:MAG: C39 family peptidase [Epulopiscium sp.]|nr:C39 family peptidase [Candidatus Epulonipiscium sp.]
MSKKQKQGRGFFFRLFLSVLILFFSFMLYEKKHNPELYHKVLGIFQPAEKEQGEEIPLVQQDITPKAEENTYIIDSTTNSCTLIGGPYHITYYNQNDARWKDKIYGKKDTIGVYGCGPTVLAMIVSSLTEDVMTPDAMAAWAYKNNFFCPGSGSYHSIIPNGASSFGLQVTSLKTPSKETIIQELCTGKILVALMKKGTFTASGGHFIILRSASLDGKVYIADPQSLDNSMKEWDVDLLISELKTNASSGGPVWAISAP